VKKSRRSAAYACPGSAPSSAAVSGKRAAKGPATRASHTRDTAPPAAAQRAPQHPLPETHAPPPVRRSTEELMLMPLKLKKLPYSGSVTLMAPAHSQRRAQRSVSVAASAQRW
jgi:hypothetical protein